MAPENKNNKPAETIRLGRIRVTIWANRSEEQETWYNVTVSRLYQVEGEWKDSGSFRRDDLPVVAKAVDMAYAWIWNQRLVAEQTDA